MKNYHFNDGVKVGQKVLFKVDFGKHPDEIVNRDETGIVTMVGYGPDGCTVVHVDKPHDFLADKGNTIVFNNSAWNERNLKFADVFQVIEFNHADLARAHFVITSLGLKICEEGTGTVIEEPDCLMRKHVFGMLHPELL